MCMQCDLCFMNTTCTYTVANVYRELCSKDFLEDFVTLVSTSPSGGRGWCFRQNVLACPASSGISRDVATEGPSTSYTWEKWWSGSIRIRRSETSREGGTPLFSSEFELSSQSHACFQRLMMFGEARKPLGNGSRCRGGFEGNTHSWVWFYSITSWFLLLLTATASYSHR